MVNTAPQRSLRFEYTLINFVVSYFPLTRFKGSSLQECTAEGRFHPFGTSITYVSPRKRFLSGRDTCPTSWAQNKKFKKIKEVVLEKDTDKFYYNLVFYGFVDWDRYIGYLIKDTKNFYIKIESPSEKWDDNELEEELLITEEMARTVLNYDEILEKQDREFLKYEEQ